MNSMRLPKQSSAWNRTSSRPDRRAARASAWRQTGCMTHLAEIETCDECQFVSSDYTHDDLLGTLRAVAPMWRTMVEGIDEDVLASPARTRGVVGARVRRPLAADVTRLLDLLVAGMVEQESLVFDDEPLQPDDIGDPVTPASIDEAIDELDEAARALVARVHGIPDATWGHTHTWGAADARSRLDRRPCGPRRDPPSQGRGAWAPCARRRRPEPPRKLAQINTSDGGVPKTPVSVAEVGTNWPRRRRPARPTAPRSTAPGGVPVERGSDRLAVSEGHPIGAGLAGENLTLSGVDWSTIRPGVRLLVGDVSIEISAWATPCAKNAAWFADGDFNRMSHERHPGSSRAYAWVLEGGTVRVGDEVVVEP